VNERIKGHELKKLRTSLGHCTFSPVYTTRKSALAPQGRLGGIRAKRENFWHLKFLRICVLARKESGTLRVRAGQDFLGGIFRNVIFSDGFLRHLVDFVGNLENFASVPNMDPLG
jgi:hypothetical protein